MGERVLEPPFPPLADEVVLLRTWSDGDASQLYEACQDPIIQRFIPIPRPYTLAAAEGYIERTRRQWEDGQKAAFAIVEATDPSIVAGAINLAVSGPCGNAAYWVVPPARSRGIASRALRLVTDWAVDTLGMGVILLEIHRANEASIHVAQNAGYHVAGQLEVNTETGERNHLIFSHLAAD